MFGCSNHRGGRHEGVHESEFPRPSFDRISKVTARVLGRACVRARVDDGESGRVAFVESLCRRFAERQDFPVFRLRNRTDQFSASGQNRSERNRKRKGIDRKVTPWPCAPWLEATRTAPRSRLSRPRRDLSFPLPFQRRETINSPFDRPIRRDGIANHQCRSRIINDSR